MDKNLLFMYSLLAIILIIGLIFISFYFTPNSRAKNFGGKLEIKIEKGYKLIEATWKNNDLWYLIEKVDTNTYIPQTKIFKENSNIGIMEGTIIFIEQ